MIHKDVIKVATPVLYSDELPISKQAHAPVNLGLVKTSNPPAEPATVENLKLMICTLPCPRPTMSEPNKTAHLVSTVLEYPQGMTRFGCVQEELMLNMLLADEEAEDALEYFLQYCMTPPLLRH
jgi:hypothetical protein